MVNELISHVPHKDTLINSEQNSPQTQTFSRESHLGQYQFEESSSQSHPSNSLYSQQFQSEQSQAHQSWSNNQCPHVPNLPPHPSQSLSSMFLDSSVLSTAPKHLNSHSTQYQLSPTISTLYSHQSHRPLETSHRMVNRPSYQKDCSFQISKFIHSSSPPRILILYVGGTIGMKPSPNGYLPEPNYLEHLLRSMPQFHDPKISSDPLHLVLPRSEYGQQIHYAIKEYSPLCDSSNMTMKDWVMIAKDIQAHYDAYDGFVILHGTDTMTYTCSALSFMLEYLDKPVIITGAQVPISEARNDAQSNLIIALTIAGHFRIPEVSLYFSHKLMRGNRSIKLSALDFDAFHSPNFPPLIKVGVKMDVHWSAIEELDQLQKGTPSFPAPYQEKIHAQRDEAYHESNSQPEVSSQAGAFSSQTAITDPDQSLPPSWTHRENPSLSDLANTTNVSSHLPHITAQSFLSNSASSSTSINPTPQSASIITSITATTTATRLHVHTQMNPNIGILRLFPGITEHTVKAFLQDPMAGVVLCTYGTGNAPDNRPELLEAFRQACQRGVIIVNCTQCIYGSVNIMYPSARMLQHVGILSGADMTIECAIAKLSYLLGKGYPIEKVRQLMATNLRGEMTITSE